MTPTKPHYRVKRIMSKPAFDAIILMVMIFPGPFFGLRVVENFMTVKYGRCIVNDHGVFQIEPINSLAKLENFIKANSGFVRKTFLKR